MNIIEEKIVKAIKTKKFNPEILGERKWYNYFIKTTQLIWSRNLIDGYLVEVYEEKYGLHLCSIIV